VLSYLSRLAGILNEEVIMVSIEDFKKLELKVAQIKEVNDHPNADRLYVITVDLGDRTKQVVAGIKGSYQREDLIGRQVVVVDNLESAVLRGVESQGMLLAASDETGVTIISPERKVKLGSTVK
jgi:methionyl-tRNA synthetase